MEIKKTITSIFMVPTLKVPRGTLKDKGFINGYSKTTSADSRYNDVIYVLFKPANLDKFSLFVASERQRTKSLLADYECIGGYVVLVYQLDPRFRKDFEIVRTGKYSTTSHEFQNVFPKTVKIEPFDREEISLQYRIFKKTKDLVKFWEDKFDLVFDAQQEIWHGYFEENETLDLAKIKAYA